MAGSLSPKVTPQMASQSFDHTLQQKFGGDSPQSARARYDRALDSTRAEVRFRLPHYFEYKPTWVFQDVVRRARI